MANRPMTEENQTLRKKLRSYGFDVRIRHDCMALRLPNDDNAYVLERIGENLFDIYKINKEFKAPRTSRRKIHAKKTRQEVLFWAFDYAERKGAFDGTLPIQGKDLLPRVSRL